MGTLVYSWARSAQCIVEWHVFCHLSDVNFCCYLFALFFLNYFILTIIFVGDQNYPISLQVFLISTAKTVDNPLVDDLALSHARFHPTCLTSVLNFFFAHCPGPLANQSSSLPDANRLYWQTLSCSRKAFEEQLWPLQSFVLLEESPWILYVVTGCSANPALTFITAFTYIQHLELETYCTVNSNSDFFIYKTA